MNWLCDEVRGDVVTGAEVSGQASSRVLDVLEFKEELDDVTLKISFWR